VTFCLLQIQTYKTPIWTAFLWFYVAMGILLAIPLTVGQILLEQFRHLRYRWLDPAAL